MFSRAYLFKAEEEDEEESSLKPLEKNEATEEKKRNSKSAQIWDAMISKQKTYLIMTLYLVFSADSGSPVVFLILRMSARDRERVMMCRE